MKLKRITKILCLNTLPLAMCGFIACANKRADDVEVVFPIKTFVTDTYSFSVPVQFKNKTLTSAVFEITNNPDNSIYADDKILDIVDSKAICNLKINENIVEPKKITFSIKIMRINNNGKKQSISSDQLSVDFIGQKPSTDDKVICPEQLKRYENVHSANFTFYFYAEPSSEYVDLVLHDSSGKLSLENKRVKPIRVSEESNLWYIDATINIFMGIIHSSFFNFNLSLIFTNSHEVSQTVVFDDLVAHFVQITTDEVPSDYFDVRDGALYGLKEGISPAHAGHFKVLNIPSGIINIESNAFTDKQWLSGIKKIIIPSSVENIGLNAFSGCDNLFEIDASSYPSSIVPAWLRSGVKMFDTNSLKLHVGYLWVSNTRWHEISYLTQLIGLNSDWITCKSDMVTPEDVFIFGEGVDKETIIGINDDYEDFLWYYKVIRIPEKTKKILCNFDLFANHAFFLDGRADQIETRRLIFNKNLEQVGDIEANESCLFNGISGPVYFPCEKDVKFNKNAFNSMHLYYDVETEYTVEPIKFVFDRCDEWTTIPDQFIVTALNNFPYVSNEQMVLPQNLTKIGNYAFNFVNYEAPFQLPSSVESIGEFAFSSWKITGTLVLPENIKSIGSCAFDHQHLEKLIFTGPIESIGSWCFGLSDQTPTPECSYSLKEIDLSYFETVPQWISAEKNCLFMNGCNKDGGIVYLNPNLSDQDFNTFKEKLVKECGIPNNWSIEKKNSG